MAIIVHDGDERTPIEPCGMYHSACKLGVFLIAETDLGTTDKMDNWARSGRRQRRIICHLCRSRALIVHAMGRNDPRISTVPVLAMAQKIAKQTMEVSASLEFADHRRIKLIS